MPTELDPDVIPFLEAIAAAESQPISQIPLSELRSAVEPVPGPPEPVDSVQDRQIPAAFGAVPVRVYEPTGCWGTCLFFHGGGWATGDLESHDALARRLANASQWRVVAVDYRRSPEHPFPAAVDDAAIVAAWATQQFQGQPLAVCGDSAGGNIAAGLSLMARDHGSPAIDAQVLIYPVIDSTCQTESYRLWSEGYFLTGQAMRWFWQQYAPEPALAEHPYASPSFATQLEGLPRAFILTAECDILRDEGRNYAARLCNAGVSVEFTERRGMVHGFIRRLNRFRAAGEVCEQIGSYLKQIAAAQPR